MKGSISIVIPAHNEEENLPPTIKELEGYLKSKKIKAEIVIVDDNSNDKTYQVSMNLNKKYKNITSVKKDFTPGMGATLKYGTKRARGDIIIWMMADLEDDIRAIPGFIQKINEGYDMVIASRYMKGGDSGDLGKFKMFLSRGFSVLSRILVGIPVHDVTYAYRAFRKPVLAKTNPEADNFSISPEFALMAHLKGFKLGEVPVTFRSRQMGVAKMKLVRVGSSYSKILLRAVKIRIFGK